MASTGGVIQNMKALYCTRCYDSEMKTLTRSGERWLCDYCVPEATPDLSELEEAEEDNCYTYEEVLAAESQPAKAPKTPPVLEAQDVQVSPTTTPAYQQVSPPTHRKRRSSLEAEDILCSLRRRRVSEEEDNGENSSTWWSDPATRDWVLPWQQHLEESPELWKRASLNPL